MSIVHYQLSIEMKNNERDDRFEKRLRFVVRHYKEGSLDEDKAWKRFAFRQGICRQVAFRRYWMAAASVVLLLIGFGTFYVKERNNPEWVSVATVSGQLTEVTVLGTSFQVSEQPDMTEVDVVTGKVRFAAGKEPEPVILTAGMSASYSNEKKEIDILKEENPNNLSWKTKQLRFNDTPLEKVIRDLNEYYQVEIINKVDVSCLPICHRDLYMLPADRSERTFALVGGPYSYCHAGYEAGVLTGYFAGDRKADRPVFFL